MNNKMNFVLLVSCLWTLAAAVPKIKTVSVHAPTSGAALDPIGTLLAKTKLQKHQLGYPYGGLLASPYGLISPYAGGYNNFAGVAGPGGLGFGSALGAYGGVISPFGAAQGYSHNINGYGTPFGSQYNAGFTKVGFPGVGVSEHVSVQSPHPALPSSAQYKKTVSYPTQHSLLGITGYPAGLSTTTVHKTAVSYPAQQSLYGYGGYPSVAGLAGYGAYQQPYGVGGQLGYGYPLGAVNKLRGY